MLSRDDALATVQALRACNGNQTDAAVSLGLRRSTLQDRVKRIEVRFPDIKIPELTHTRKGGTGRQEHPATLKEQVEHTRARATEVDTRKRLKEALAQITALEDRLKDLEWAHNVELTPANWTLDTRSPKGKSPHVPVLFFSDAQAGEVVRADECDTPWDYNTQIFRDRYRKMIQTTIDLALNHGGTRWVYPGCHYIRGGDNISGGLHEDLRELGEDATPVQQAEIVAEEEARGILHLAEAFGRVEVQTPGASGNHDRTTHKPPTKLAWARSYDRLVHKLLVGEFKNDKRVHFHISRSPDIRFPIFAKRALCTHGDRIGSRGGMGFVGPGATILRGWQRLLMEQATLGYQCDFVFTGHFHYPMCLPIGQGNGSFTGTTEYGKSFRLPPQAPLQYLSFWHPQHGMVDVRPIYLA